MDTKFDLLVIGTGTAASVAATRCRAAGWQVAVIDHRPYGGTCALRGCDPKKMLIAGAEAIDAAHRMSEREVVRGEIGIDWPALMRFKRSFTDPVPERRRAMFAEKGIAAFRGRARLSGTNHVTVGEQVLEGRYIVIAAGAEPVALSIEGHQHVLLSDDFLDLETLPRRIVFIGAGYIGFEFAHIAARAGAEVTLLQRSARPLPAFDPDLVALLVERTRRLGVNVQLRHEVVRVEPRGSAFAVTAMTSEGDARFDADLVVHSAGREPAVEALDLDAAGVEHDGAVIHTNEHLQSRSNPAVYIAGDASSTRLPLTPVAALEGKAVAANLLEGNHAQVDYNGIPSAVFSLPPLARVGMLEAEAKEAGLHFVVKHEVVPHWYTAVRVNEPCYGFKTLVDKGTDRVLGAHVVGPDAPDVVNLFALAVRSGLTARDLKYAKFVYPTAASDLEYMLP